MKNMTDNIKVISVKSIYGMRTNKALVEINIPSNTGTVEENNNLVIRLTTHDARALALNILAASDASTVDAFLIEFMRDMGTSEGFDEENIRKLIVAFRQYRETHANDGR